jgi:IS5 family transposase
MHLFYSLSEPGMEDALYEIEFMRHFTGLKLDRRPDETAILKFRHTLESHGLPMQDVVQGSEQHLEKNGLILREGSIVDTTMISEPSSTKNECGQRVPEMHQAKKGNEWHFGMKMHIGMDDAFGPIHSINTTAANAHDFCPAATFSTVMSSACSVTPVTSVFKSELIKNTAGRSLRSSLGALCYTENAV